jgi:hypothetical protein
MRHAPRGSGRWGFHGSRSRSYGCALGIGGRFAAQLVGSDHEPSHCLGGMWLYPRRVFCLLAEHGLLQVVTGDRNLANRVRAAGRGCEDVARPDLPHAVRADRAGRRNVGHRRTRRLPAADGIAATRPGGWRHEAVAQSALRGAAGAASADAGEEEEAGGRQEEADHGRRAAGSWAACARHYGDRGISSSAPGSPGSGIGGPISLADALEIRGQSTFISGGRRSSSPWPGS